MQMRSRNKNDAFILLRCKIVRPGVKTKILRTKCAAFAANYTLRSTG